MPVDANERMRTTRVSLLELDAVTVDREGGPVPGGGKVGLDKVEDLLFDLENERGRRGGRDVKGDDNGVVLGALVGDDPALVQRAFPMDSTVAPLAEITDEPQTLLIMQSVRSGAAEQKKESHQPMVRQHRGGTTTV